MTRALKRIARLPTVLAAAAHDPHRALLRTTRRRAGCHERPQHRLDRNLALEAVRVTEAAALAASRLIGRGDEKAADQAAVDAMRTALNALHRRHRRHRRGRARRGADALHRREGRHRQRPERRHRARPARRHDADRQGRANALAVMAMAAQGGMLECARHLHGQDRRRRRVSGRRRRPRRQPADNIKALAKAKRVEAADIAACVLDRPRHAEIIASMREAARASS